MNETWRAIERALQNRDRELPGYGKELRRCAAELSSSGDFVGALNVLDEVIGQPETEFDRFAGLRMKGQYLFYLGRNDEARSAFDEVLRLADAGPLPRGFGASYASVVTQYTNLLVVEQSLELARGMNARLTTRALDDVDSEPVAIAGALHTSANLSARLGDHAQAVAAIDELFQRFPDYGRQNGQRVNLGVVRAQQNDPTLASDAYVQELATLWADEQLSGDAEMMMVGLLLSEAHERRGERDLVIDQDQQTLARADRLLARSRGRDPSDLGQRRIREAVSTTLSRLSTADEFGEFHVASRALTRLRDSSSSDAERQQFVDQLRRLEARR